MEITVNIGGNAFRVASRRGHSIAIPLDPAGPQPNHFGVPKAAQSTIVAGDFVGDTRRGGSCNVDRLEITPHCNGTHTESVGHIVNEDVPVGALVRQPGYLAAVVSVTPEAARDTAESYRPELDHHDTLVTAAALSEAFANVVEGQNPGLARGSGDTDPIEALVIRTLPNDPAKRHRAWGNPIHPAFLTVEAMEWVVAAGFQHLLLDLPSVDRMYDDGLLTNHHVFWNVPEHTHALTDDCWREKTITEMVFVDDKVHDGLWLLNLQLPAVITDAVPSRPLLFALED